MIERSDLRDHPAHRAADEMRSLGGQKVEQADEIRSEIVEEIAGLGSKP